MLVILSIIIAAIALMVQVYSGIVYKDPNQQLKGMYLAIIILWVSWTLLGWSTG